MYMNQLRKLGHITCMFYDLTLIGHMANFEGSNFSNLKHPVMILSVNTTTQFVQVRK